MEDGIRDGDCDVSLRSRETPPHVIINICTTGCLLRLLWGWASYTRSAPLVDSCIKVISTCAARVVFTMPDALRHIPVEVEDQVINLQVGRHGTVIGFRDLLKARFPLESYRRALLCTWEGMCSIGCLDAQLDLFGDAHSIGSIFTFLVGFLPYRKQKKDVFCVMIFG